MPERSDLLLRDATAAEICNELASRFRAVIVAAEFHDGSRRDGTYFVQVAGHGLSVLALATLIAQRSIRHQLTSWPPPGQNDPLGDLPYDAFAGPSADDA